MTTTPEKNYVMDLSGRFTIIPDELIENKNLTNNEKMVYIYLKKFTSKDNMTAFPSYKTICEHLNITKPTLSKSLKKLEEEGWIKVERRKVAGTNEHDTNLYTILPVPDHAKSSRTPTLTKIQQEGKTEQKETNEKERLKIKEYSIRLGVSYKLNDKHIDILEKEGQIPFVLHILEGKQKPNHAKTKDSFIKGIFSFLKVFERMPNEEEIEKIDQFLSEYEPRTLLESMKEAKKENLSIFDPFFEVVLKETKNHFEKQAEYWKLQNYEPKAKKEIKGKKEFRSIASRYQVYDEDDEKMYDLFRD